MHVKITVGWYFAIGTTRPQIEEVNGEQMVKLNLTRGHRDFSFKDLGSTRWKTWMSQEGKNIINEIKDCLRAQRGKRKIYAHKTDLEGNIPAEIIDIFVRDKKIRIVNDLRQSMSITADAALIQWLVEEIKSDMAEAETVADPAAETQVSTSGDSQASSTGSDFSMQYQPDIKL